MNDYPKDAASAPAGHSDDIAVDRFADAMKAKLTKARDKGRGGWDDPAQCTVEHLRDLLHSHVAKGDPVDVANFCMMLFHRGGSTSAPAGDGVEALHQSAAKYAAICDKLADQTPVVGEPDPLWWERQSALREAGVLLAALARPRAAVGEQSREAPATITYNPVYRMAYEGSDPSRGHVYALQSAPAKVEGA